MRSQEERKEDTGVCPVSVFVRPVSKTKYPKINLNLTTHMYLKTKDRKSNAVKSKVM
jgi:hypothetical protein